ncbi:hypothetical protein AUQ34_17425 [Escherichia coli]|jgi:hypothetical protein|nr:hypothetical protein [Escherichia coli]EFN7789259.1 hypothetical protein [Escherichia coli]EFO1437922.1 hypothetical protein [Escherichia coli]EFO2741318.1 hypothetical protein [Escherichia coli]EFO3918146.1 hypothetical protein [Escherichia coli]
MLTGPPPETHKKRTPQRKEWIVWKTINASSQAAKVGNPNLGFYGATRFTIYCIPQTAAKNLVKPGITIRDKYAVADADGNIT